MGRRSDTKELIWNLFLQFLSSRDVISREMYCTELHIGSQICWSGVLSLFRGKSSCSLGHLRTTWIRGSCMKGGQALLREIVGARKDSPELSAIVPPIYHPNTQDMLRPSDCTHVCKASHNRKYENMTLYKYEQAPKPSTEGGRKNICVQLA